MSTRLTYELKGDTAYLTMNDGKVNIMSLEMLNDIDAALDRAENEAKVLVLRSGIPGNFSAGFDLKVFAANDVKKSVDMVRSGAELALRLLSFPMPTVGVMEGHAYPMGTFLLLACDVRIGAKGGHRMGLNEVAIRITPPTFAIELARSRVHPAWLSRTVTLGEMFGPEDALVAGFLDKIVDPKNVENTVADTVDALTTIHIPSHVAAKKSLRRHTIKAIREAIENELTLEAYQDRPSNAVKLPDKH